MTSNKTWRVVTGPRERKFLNTIPLMDHERIVQALDELAVDPWYGDIQKLGGEKNTWRRRIGNYRISYSIHSEQNLIMIEDIDRRTTTNYRKR